MGSPTIQPHNLTAAMTWNSGGSAYDRVSATTADAIDHCILRLDPQPRAHVLDVATGTGWAARRVTARGTTAVGIDLGADLITAASATALQAGLKIDFRVADAENLPFANHSFDAVLSTFGVMFV